MTETFTATAKTLSGNKPWTGKVTAETPWAARNLATTMAARETGQAVHRVKLFRDEHTEVGASEIWPGVTPCRRPGCDTPAVLGLRYCSLACEEADPGPADPIVRG